MFCSGVISKMKATQHANKTYTPSAGDDDKLLCAVDKRVVDTIMIITRISYARI